MQIGSERWKFVVFCQPPFGKEIQQHHLRAAAHLKPRLEMGKGTPIDRSSA
jgi:hypothetical protein